MSDKLTLNNEFRQLDTKNRDFYDELTDEERKKFSTYLMLKYSANVEGPADFQEWYLRAANERVNQNFFDLGKHTKLQWLECTAVSPGMGVQRHYWLKGKAKEGNTKVLKFIQKIRPELKADEAELLSEINTVAELKEYARGLGMPDSEIKKELG